ncbi:DGQHR domain-containing protein [Rheinheimera hassiensis]|uniref:DGQHR domain-containing protein n=1 Tax=Rheinheimera hassiensis TaxID=1193627 RepID=UPI001F05EF5A|nr:DGQHR domain-containing protein [Rheinheimera hassiensis]
MAQLQLPTSSSVMTSPSGKPLVLLLTKTSEPIEKLGVETYEATLTYRELSEHFGIEANSDSLAEAAKRQRDVDAKRVNGLKAYWATSAGAVFPSMTFFANSIEVTAHHTIAGKNLVEAVLAADADRFISDGQGRTTFINWLLSTPEAASSEHYTIAFKLLVTNTDTLADEKASMVMKQLFADYHKNLIKPNKSVSKLFDSSTPFARLQSELLNTAFGRGGKTYGDRIALHGKIRRGNLWTFDQFTGMVGKFIGFSATQANKELADEAVYNDVLSLCRAWLNKVGQIVPAEMLDTDNYLEVHESCIFTKAIFASALGFVGKSIVEEMLQEPTISWDVLVPLSMPITSKEDKYWQANKVTMSDDGRIKIIKGTDKRIGSLICRELRIYPCEELAA